MNINRINGIGALFRFVTPVLVTIVLFILSMMQTDIRELKIHFTNHLADHKEIEIKLEKRITTIETVLGLDNGLNIDRR